MKSLLAIFLAASATSVIALEVGDPVFARVYGDTWTAAKFVSTSQHCFETENTKKKRQLWPTLHENYGGKVEVGGEIFFRFGQLKNEPKYRVLSIDLTCHVVQTDREHTVEKNDMVPASEFRKLLGSKTEFAVGDKVYVQVGVESEEWALHTISAKRDDCLETDGPTVLYADGTEELYVRPPTTTKVKVGDKILANLSFAEQALIPVTVRKKKGKKLIVSAPYVEGDGEFEEEVKLPTPTYLSSPMTPTTFASLKTGAQIMLFKQPEACDLAFYRPIEIVGTLRRCYLVQAHDTFAQMARQIISAEALPKK